MGIMKINSLLYRAHDPDQVLRVKTVTPGQVISLRSTDQRPLTQGAEGGDVANRRLGCVDPLNSFAQLCTSPQCRVTATKG